MGNSDIFSYDRLDPDPFGMYPKLDELNIDIPQGSRFYGVMRNLKEGNVVATDNGITIDDISFPHLSLGVEDEVFRVFLNSKRAVHAGVPESKENSGSDLVFIRRREDEVEEERW